LRLQPGNLLEALKHDRAAQHSIRINEIVQGKRSITADTALRFGKFFGMEARFWMNLQSYYDLEVAKDAIVGKLDREVEVLKVAA